MISLAHSCCCSRASEPHLTSRRLDLLLSVSTRVGWVWVRGKKVCRMSYTFAGQNKKKKFGPRRTRSKMRNRADRSEEETTQTEVRPELVNCKTSVIGSGSNSSRFQTAESLLRFGKGVSFPGTKKERETVLKNWRGSGFWQELKKKKTVRLWDQS